LCATNDAADTATIDTDTATNDGANAEWTWTKPTEDLRPVGRPPFFFDASTHQRINPHQHASS
jgi:hypothetical protein